MEIEALEKKIDNLDKEVKEMKELIKELIKVCGRMDTHITFVETMYDTLKNPIECIRQRFNYLTN
jgi:hypothetical protein